MKRFWAGAGGGGGPAGGLELDQLWAISSRPAPRKRGAANLQASPLPPAPPPNRYLLLTAYYVVLSYLALTWGVYGIGGWAGWRYGRVRRMPECSLIFLLLYCRAQVSQHLCQSEACLTGLACTTCLCAQNGDLGCLEGTFRHLSAPWSTILPMWGAQGAPRKTPVGPDLHFSCFWVNIGDLLGPYFADTLVNFRDFGE